MIFEFLLPIIGWLLLFMVCFAVYTKAFHKDKNPQTHVEGQAFYTILVAAFWITVYICLSSIWSILYSLIDLKFPDLIAAASRYGYDTVGIVYDAFAFPLAMVLVSSITSLGLAFWLISKFEKNKNLRPESLNNFIRSLVYIGGTIMAFFGFVYIVYSWLYGNLPVAVFMKAGVALAIVGSVAAYFYMTENVEEGRKQTVSRVFAILLVIVTILTMGFTFSIIGTPEQARLFRLDSITLQNLQNVKQTIDNQDQSFGNKIKSLDDITDEYAKSAIAQTPIIYSTTEKDYTLCAEFNRHMPETVNMPGRSKTWDYNQGQSCFTFPHLPTFGNANTFPAGTPKPVYVQ